MKMLLDYEFEYIQDINPVLDRNGEVEEFYPQEKYNNREQLNLNKYGEGAFCRFSIHPKWSGISGVYAFFVNEELVYIGQAFDLAKRFNMGYGIISPRNCYVGGQSTNCKINKLVLNSVKPKKKVSIYFHMTHKFHEIEKILIRNYNPPYNTASTKSNNLYNENTKHKDNIRLESKELKRNDKGTHNPPITIVREFIESQIEKTRINGGEYIIIQSGIIHKELNMSNAMPTVCSAMRTLNVNYHYEVIEEPPKGNGSRLIFKYYTK